jgi:hypothetical protein
VNRDTPQPQTKPSVSFAVVCWWFAAMLCLEPMVAFVAAAIFFGIGTYEWVRWCRQDDASTIEESK